MVNCQSHLSMLILASGDIYNVLIGCRHHIYNINQMEDQYYISQNTYCVWSTIYIYLYTTKHRPRYTCISPLMKWEHTVRQPCTYTTIGAASVCVVYTCQVKSTVISVYPVMPCQTFCSISIYIIVILWIKFIHGNTLNFLRSSN